jgi:hypothetical protein
MKAPQHIEKEYDKFKAMGYDTHIVYNSHNHNFYVSIFPLSLLKVDLFTKIVK